MERSKSEVSLPSLISTTTPMNTSDKPRQGKPVLRMKNATVHYNAKADKVTSESIQQCSKDMYLDFSKYDTLKAHRQEHKDPVTVFELEGVQKAMTIEQYSGQNSLVPL